MVKPIRILSLDGGGIRGIIPAQILKRLEEILQKSTGNNQARIADFFDLVAGSSTGGILACLHLCPGAKNPAGFVRPRFSAQEVVNFYLEDGPQIFKSPLVHKISSVFGLFGQKYSDKNLLKYLDQYFGDLKLSELLKPCLITAYNIEKRAAHFFTQHDAVKNIEDDYLVKDVAWATSAAPTYFKPAKIKSLADKYLSLIDGGVIANNPSLCALAETWQELVDRPRIKDLYILSLGTGDDQKPIPYQKAKNWGDFDWVVPIIHILMSGNAETVDFQLRTIFSAARKEEQYLRINPNLPDSMSAMDNIRPENLQNLVDYGDKTGEKFLPQLEEMANRLITGITPGLSLSQPLGKPPEQQNPGNDILEE